ncbi:MAG: RNA polymerase sporulation sigma factor SigE [Firmicutes bacterium]|nr:RNA polymerase sporulation sigma factor SigE [Bacillota bacterium]MDD4693430.1 RNA polymerase sporulation sigma factor SigE [Bacillota bacterium]
MKWLKRFLAKLTHLSLLDIKLFLSRFLRRRRFVYYVGSSEVLPPPLLPEEERVLLKKLQSGEVSVKSTLIERNLRLVVYIARKFENTGVGIEDLVSIGTIGLIKAVNTFDISKNIKLATYASRCIENEILMFLRRHQRTKEVYLEDPLNTDWDGNELSWLDVLPAADGDGVYQVLEEETDRNLLKAALLKLEPREQEIVTLRYGLGIERELTQKEVADKMGISQSYISRLEKRIMKKLRRELKKFD